MLSKGKLLAGAAAAAALVGSVGVFAAELDAKGSVYGDLRYSLDYAEDNSGAPGPTYTTTDNNSYWGVKASTTQGGITAFGAYERFVDIDGNFFLEFIRQGYVGLGTEFGTVKYGTHATAYAEAGRKLDPFYNTAVTGLGGVGALGGFLGGNSHGSSAVFNSDFNGSAYISNHVAYQSPSVFGITANAAFMTDETGTSNQDHNYGLGVEWNGMGITAGFQMIDDNNGTWLAPDEEASRLYGSYAAGRFGVGASYERFDLTGGANDAEFLMVSGWFGVLPGTRVAASYGQENESGAEGNSIRLGVFHDVIQNFTVWAAALRYDEAAGVNPDSDVITLGASYKFDLGFSTR